MNPNDIRQIIDAGWPCDHETWFARLAAEQLIGIDWPQHAWHRDDQLALAQLLAEHRCPIMPDTVSLVAPAVIAWCPRDVAGPVLDAIATNPLDPDIRAELVVDNLVIRLHGQTVQVGPPGDGARLLALSFSPFCLLLETLLGIAHIKALMAHWELSADKAVTALEVAGDALKGLFLQNRETADQQLALSAQALRLDVYWQMNGYLGYYALLDPDPLASANEPVPFAEERRFLKSIRQGASRDERLQRDRLFVKVANEPT